MTLRLNPAKFFGREYHRRNYNCWDFIREVWLDAGGVDIGHRTPESCTSEGFRRAFAEQEQDIDGKLVFRIKEPEEPCLVMLLRPGVMSHVGVYTRGRLFHLHQRKGVVMEPLAVAALGYNEVRFYK